MNEHCPVLSIQQLYRISTMYWDDKYGTRSVSSDVISSIRVMMTEDSNNSVSSSFLLDDNSRYCSRYFYKCYSTVWYCPVCHLTHLHCHEGNFYIWKPLDINILYSLFHYNFVTTKILKYCEKIVLLYALDEENLQHVMKVQVMLWLFDWQLMQLK